MRIAALSTAILASGLAFGGASQAVVAPFYQKISNAEVSQVQIEPAKATESDQPVPAQAAPEPTPPQTITVQLGDYLTKLAEANDTTALRLFYANTDITDPDLIYPNQVLRVPTADEQLTPREVPQNVQIIAPTPAAASAAAAPVAVAAPVYRPAPAPVATTGDGGVWDRIAACESGGNWAINTGNGFYGGLQFTLSSWRAVGGSGLPSDASKAEQIARGQMLQARQGWGAWPVCSLKAGMSY